MKQILQYIYLYFREVNRVVFLASTLFIAFLVWANYSFHIDPWMSRQNYPARLFLYYSLYLLAFLLPYLFYRMSGTRAPWRERLFLILLFTAPLIFAFKHTFSFPFHIGERDIYWNHIAYWPFLALACVIVLYIVWKLTRLPGDNFYGLSIRRLDLRPYLFMLLMMIPLVAAASTQPDFLAMYPKMKVVTGSAGGEGPGLLHKILFELAYGSDFITIELFFRGFLVLAFVRWVGKEAILPMACFYCTIHFGKPVGECISSYFGGILLGIVVFHTRSIIGGLIVHLGIAWMMEAGGYLGDYFRK